MPRRKVLFEKNKLYYLPSEDWKLKFVKEEPGGMSVAATHYTFKVMTPTEEEWEEYTTTQPSEIWKTKAEYVKSLKSEKPIITTSCKPSVAESNQ